MSPRDSVAALEKSLRRRFRVVETNVDVSGRALSILHPASAEDLISEHDFDQDERLPYWAELWPSSRALGEALLGSSGAGRSLLELGCGAGLVSTCASLAGFAVTASDYYDDALRFARVNARRNSAPALRGLLLDWRRLPPDLERFDAVVASDVLYERPYGRLVAEAIRATLAVGGTALVTDPGRVGRDEFIQSLGSLGLIVYGQNDVPFLEGSICQIITLFDIRHRA